MKDPVAWVTQIMNELGHDTLLCSTEDMPGSVWVDIDRAPHGVAGYYEKRRIPLRHRWVRDGRVVALDFERGGIKYRVRCGHESTAPENERRVAEVVGTVLGWIDASIVTWAEGFAGFVRDATDGTEWWRILRLPLDATIEEIERAYRRLAFETHPDRGGNADAFRHVSEAYERALAARQ